MQIGQVVWIQEDQPVVFVSLWVLHSYLENQRSSQPFQGPLQKLDIGLYQLQHVSFNGYCTC